MFDWRLLTTVVEVTWAVAPRRRITIADGTDPVRATIKIELNATSDDLIHRFKNLGEDVYRVLRDRCSVNLEEIDRARDSFFVREIRRRDIGSVLQIIQRLVRQHGLESAVRLGRMDRSEL